MRHRRKVAKISLADIRGGHKYRRIEPIALGDGELSHSAAIAFGYVGVMGRSLDPQTSNQRKYDGSAACFPGMLLAPSPNE